MHSSVVATEGAVMLPEPSDPAWSETDREVFERLVATDHYLRIALKTIDFERFRGALAEHYSPDHGRPAEEPIRMLKLGFLQYHDNLSDRQVIERAQTDVAYRYFLGLRLEDELPDPSLLCIFRGRLGVEGYRLVFHEVVAQAREHGLVKDRMRLKDATHVIADVALPTTLALLAQVRNKLLTAAESFDPVRVAGERARVEMIRTSTDGHRAEERLMARLTHLREIMAWVEKLSPPEDAERNRPWQTLQSVLRLARKILSESEDPKRGDRTRSTVDPDARRGKHGDFYDGYLLDVMIDADSELFTALNVLPANGDEAADAAELLRQEEAAHGNDVQQLSIDGIGFQGEVLRELEDPQGLAVDVIVPPKGEPATGKFGPRDFVEDTARGVVTCPAGRESHYRQRDTNQRVTIYRFAQETCAGCPLRDGCLTQPSKTFGRTVRKNDYEAEYRRAREKATTAEYAAVRCEHPKIERKLSELVRRHGARRARYWGDWKVLCQQLLAATVANVKRIVRLLSAPTQTPAAT